MSKSRCNKLLGETARPCRPSRAAGAGRSAAADAPPVDIDVDRTAPMLAQRPRARWRHANCSACSRRPKRERRTRRREACAIEGIAPTPPPGRADDFCGAASRHAGTARDRRRSAVATDDQRHRPTVEPALIQPVYRGRTDDPISASSIARAACRPSRIAQTTSDWPRRTSPAA